MISNAKSIIQSLIDRLEYGDINRIQTVDLLNNSLDELNEED